ncbi:MAG: HAD-IIA family hydrolase [Phycisphaerae bacterium]
MLLDLNSYAAVLFDVDGTLCHGDEPIEPAPALVRRLQAAGVNLACLTNSTNSADQLHHRLGRMGIEVPVHHLWTAAAAAADYCVQHGWGRVLNLSGDGFAQELAGRAELLGPEAASADAVVVGGPLCASVPHLRAGLRLCRGGAKLLGVCNDRVYTSPAGIEFGAGSFCALLGFGADVPTVFAGKPEPVFFRELCQRLGVNPTECLLIGDNLESDIAGAKGVGMSTVLTLTGVASEADVQKLPPEIRPDAVVTSLEQLHPS